AHLPLRKAARALEQSEIVRVGLLLADFLNSRALTAPCIAVAGLNPHAGESGKLGREEIEIIAPAIAELKRLLLTSHQSQAAFTGPHSPDTIFHRAIEGEFDAVGSEEHTSQLQS